MTESTEQTEAQGRGVVYVVVTGRWGSADLSGCLMADTGEVMWNHILSSMSWLRRDLTDGFPDRAAKLAAKYPAGYDVVEIASADDKIPDDVMARNEAWADAQPDSAATDNEEAAVLS